MPSLEGWPTKIKRGTFSPWGKIGPVGHQPSILISQEYHANTNTEKGLYCAIRNHRHNLKKPGKIRGIYRKKVIKKITINFLSGMINYNKKIFCWIEGVNNDLVYQLGHQNKFIKLSMKKLVNTLNYTWVIKDN